MKQDTLTNRFFIFGVPRSGTTLLSNLLSQHESVQVLIDSMLYQKTKQAYEMFEKQCSVDKRLPNVDAPLTYTQAKYVMSIVMFWLLEIQYDMPFRDDVYGSWLPTYQQRIDPHPILELAKKQPVTLRCILDRFYFQLLGDVAKSVTCYGEKTPSNSLFCDWVVEAYPDAKIIINIRNPLKNVASIYNRSVEHELDLAIELYTRFYACLERIMDMPHVKIIRHEDLLGDLDGMGCSLFKYLEVEPRPFQSEFKPVLREDYIGTSVTKEKDKKLGQVFNEEENDTIRSKCTKVLEQFYPEELA